MLCSELTLSSSRRVGKIVLEGSQDLKAKQPEVLLLSLKQGHEQSLSSVLVEASYEGLVGWGAMVQGLLKR